MQIKYSLKTSHYQMLCSHAGSERDHPQTAEALTVPFTTISEQAHPLKNNPT